MDRKKIMYIGIILILTVIASITYFSYAFFTGKSEDRGKLNIVAGTLDYSLKSSDLENNSITLAAGEIKTIEIVIKSLNSVNSNYELYYDENTNVSVGYSSDTVDNTSGAINAKTSKNVTLVLKNNTSTNQTITFGVKGGFISKSIELASNQYAINTVLSTCPNGGTTWDFEFDPDNDGQGQVQTFNVPCDGIYKLETWGGQGYSASAANYGGYGGYATGTVSLSNTDTLYLYVGQQGQGGSATASYYGYPNASSTNGYTNNIVNGGAGGGSTHISLLNKKIDEHTSEELVSLLIVSGGGGSSVEYSGWKGIGGAGGGYTGGNGIRTLTDQGNHAAGTGGTQSSGGTPGHCSNAGTFGNGGGDVAAGGGGGYYGGGASQGSSAGGGSGYIGNRKLLNKSMYCYGCSENLIDTSIFTVSTTGSSSYRDTTNCSSGYSSNPTSKCAKAGNGYARITYIAEPPTTIKNIITGRETATTENSNYSYGNNKLNISFNTSNSASLGCRVIFRNPITTGGVANIKGKISVDSTSGTAVANIKLGLGSTTRATDGGQPLLTTLNKGNEATFDEKISIINNTYLTILIGRENSNYSGSLSGTVEITDFYITDY